MSQIKSVTLWDLQRYGILDFQKFFEISLFDGMAHSHPSLITNTIRNNANNWQIPYEPSNQGIIAIQDKDAFFQLYFNHQKENKFTDGLKLMKANSGKAFYDVNLPYGVAHGQEITYLLGQNLTIDKIASKLVTTLIEPLHNWRQDNTLVLYSGEFDVKQIAEHMDGIVYSPHKNKPRFFKPNEQYRLKSGEMPLVVSTVKF